MEYTIITRVGKKFNCLLIVAFYTMIHEAKASSTRLGETMNIRTITRFIMQFLLSENPSACILSY
jgi:hypothetical protein